MVDVGIRVELDGAKEAGADLDTLGSKIDNVNKKVVDTGKVAPASSAAIEKLSKSLGGLLGTLDPAYAAGQKFAEGQKTLKAALDAGLISQEKYAASLALLPNAYSQVAKSAGEFGALIGKLGAAGVLAFGALEVHTIDVADKFEKMSHSVGMSVHDLAEFDLSTKQSGVGLDTFAQGIRALSKHMVDNGAIFRAAGITATNTHDAFLQLSDVFSHMPDGIDKITLANRLFDRSGQALLPLLNQGSAALQTSADSAKEYAEAMEKLAPQADKLNNSIEVLKFNISTLAISIGNDLVPWLIRMSDELKKAVDLSGSLSNAMFVIGTSDPFGTSAEHVKKYREEIEGLQKDKERLLGFNDTAGAASLQQAIDTATIRKKFYEYRQQQEALQGNTPYKDEGALIAGMDPSKLAEWKKRAELLAKIGAPKVPKNPDDTAWGSIENKVRAEDFGVSPQSMKELDLIAKLFDAGKISADKYNDALKSILDSDSVLKAEETEHARQIKQDMADRITSAQNMFGVLSEKSQDYQAQVQLGLMSESEARQKLYADRKDALPLIDDEISKLSKMAEGNEALTRKVIALQKEEAKLRQEIAATAITFEDGFNKAARAYVDAANDAAKNGAELANTIFGSAEKSLADFFRHGKLDTHSFVSDVEDELARLAARKFIVNVIFNPVMDAVSGFFSMGGGSGSSAANGGSTGSQALSFADMLSRGNSAFTDAYWKAADTGIGQWAGLSKTIGVDQFGDNVNVLTDFGQGVQTALPYLPALYNLSQGNYGAAAGGAIGAYFGGPLGAAAGSYLGGMFDGGGEDPHNNAAVHGYNLGLNKSGAFNVGSSDNTGISSFVGGPTSGSGWWSDSTALSPAQVDAINKQVAAMFAQGSAIAKTLGLDPSSINSASALPNTADAKLGSYFASIDDAFKELADSIYTNMLPSMEEFKKEGESATQTMGRLADELTLTNQIARLLGKTSVQAFGELGAASLKMRDSLVQLFGGLQNATTAFNTYYQDFYSETERHNEGVKALAATMRAMGVTDIPRTREAFRKLVEAQDLSTAAGQKMFASLVAISGQFSDLAGDADSFRKIVPPAPDAPATPGSPSAAMAAFRLSHTPAHFGYGDEFMVSRPTMFIAGDSGTEHVSISPAAGAARNGGGGGPTVIFQGPVLFDAYAWQKFKRDMKI